jgi:hypothetical protein
MDFTQKNADKKICEVCDFKCSKLSDMNRHMSTSKHKNRTLLNDLEQKNTQLFICEFCNKSYKARNSLWYHKKKCNKNCLLDEIKTNEVDKDELIIMLIKQNSELIKETSEFKNMMIEQQNMMAKVIENGSHNTTNSHNTNNTNSNNKSFNLQFFLNETCKDAMNIMDFVDSIKLQLSDLERVGELGYVEGISNIIVKNLNNLDVTQRPVHCTDKKREVLYVKDEDKWEKEDESKEKIHKVIKKVALKNQRMIPKFKEEHPDCGKSTSKFSDQYNKIILEAMGGTGNNDKEKEERIVKNISKHITLDK